MTTNIVEIQNEIKKELANKAVVDALVATTFKGLSTPNVYLAIQEGMIRGFTFENFMKKDVYAIPYGEKYSLVTSIDYARKLGKKNGVVGISEPNYKENEVGKIISCTITIKRKVDDYVGEYSATAFFDEYNTGRNLWRSKPYTMIAKVAEMHALRKACPEELSGAYAEDEMTKEVETPVVAVDLAPHKEKLEAVKNLNELKSVWSSMPAPVAAELIGLKNELKAKLTAKK